VGLLYVNRSVGRWRVASHLSPSTSGASQRYARIAMRGNVSLTKISLYLASALTLACAASTPSPEEAEGGEELEDFSQDDVEQPDLGETSTTSPEDDVGEPTAQTAKEPEFTEGMSVREAIDAVPQGTQRINIDPNDLGEPLRNFELYEPCKPRQNDHFSIQVAVWDGKAVGIDITSKPKNPTLEECIKGRIRELTWKDKVRSLNTVEYSF
jgi:hypothetical protein